MRNLGRYQGRFPPLGAPGAHEARDEALEGGGGGTKRDGEGWGGPSETQPPPVPCPPAS